MSYLEFYRLISKPWSGTKEISLIANCGRDKATKIRNTIVNEITKEGKRVPEGKTIVVPTKRVIDYLGLDQQYIIDMAKNETSMLSNNDNDRSLNYACVLH